MSEVPDSAVRTFWTDLREEFQFKFTNETSVDDLNKEVAKKERNKSFMKRADKNNPNLKKLIALQRNNPRDFNNKLGIMLGNYNRNQANKKQVTSKTKGGTIYLRDNLKWSDIEVKFLKEQKGKSNKEVVRAYYDFYGLSPRTARSIKTKYLRVKRSAA